jgi:cation diffusion facilitator CzcD-associated flavoprotein CzcO
MFPPRNAVLEYIQSFAEDEKLTDLIRFNTNVIDAEYNDDEWLVTSFDISTKQMFSEKFDALVVASGHYYQPFIPDIDGLKEYQAHEERKANGVKIMHSREYREPKEFNNLVSYDIMLHTSTVSSFLISR